MRIRIPVSIAAAIVAAALLAGCSGGSSTTSGTLPTTQSVVHQPQFTPQKSLEVPFGLAHLPGTNQGVSFPHSANPDSSATYVVSCHYYGSDCRLYSGGSEIASLTSSNGMVDPQGVISDVSGDTFIANTGAFNVPVYDTTGGTFTLDSTISDTGEYPVDTATTTKGKRRSVS